MKRSDITIKRNKSSVDFIHGKDNIWCMPSTDTPNEVAEWLMEEWPSLEDSDVAALVVEAFEGMEEADAENVMEHLHMGRVARRMAEIMEG